MIAIAPDFVPEAVCRELVARFGCLIPTLGTLDGQPDFSHRVLRLARMSRILPADDRSVRQMRAIRWLATEHLRDAFGDSRIHPEETQLVRWSAGDAQALHRDTTRASTTYAAIVYLNDDFAGGETVFEGGAAIAPRTGTLIGFHGATLRHGVRRVASGVRMTMPIWFTDQDALREP